MHRSTGESHKTGKYNWVDAKGFEYRTAYAETKDGAILEIILNIGRCADGTYIVYDISNIKEVARAVEPLKNGNINPKTTSENRKYHKNNDKSSKLNQDRNIPKTYKGALAQNERYRAAIDNLKEQIKITKGHKVGRSGIARLTAKFIAETKTSMEKEYIKTSLDEIFNKSAKDNLTADETMEELKPLLNDPPQMVHRSTLSENRNNEIKRSIENTMRSSVKTRTKNMQNSNASNNIITSNVDKSDRINNMIVTLFKADKGLEKNKMLTPLYKKEIKSKQRTLHRTL